MSSTLVNMPWMAENLTASGAWGGQQTRYNLRSCKTRPNPGVPQPDAVLSACSKVGKVIKKNKKRNDGMAAKTKKNLTCFYCGTKSKQKQEGTIKEWDCKSCCATNYLDKNGNTVDPPVNAASTVQAVAFNTAKPKSSSAEAAEDDVFCQICIKNQRLFTASLAQYLPDSEHPDYDNLLKNLDEFKAELESRYPQVCESCADRVQQKMKRNVKAARIESRGRLLRQTEKRFASRRRWQSYSEAAQDIGYDARRWGFYLRFLYSVLIGIQFFYATFCSGQSLMETIVLEDGRYHGAMSGITQWLAALVCSTTCSIGEMVQPLRLLSGLASLALSSAFIWWNPQWRLTTKQTQHKVLGLGSWYFSQVLCLMVQAGLFYCDWATPIMQSYPVGMVVLHLLSLFSVAYLWPRTSQRVKVQANKLYSVPDRAQLLYRRPSNELLPRGMNKLAEALDSITNTSTTPSTPTTTLKDNITSTPSDYPENVFIPLKRPAPIAVETWKFTNAPKPLETLSLDDPPPVYSEEMDWEPNCNTMSKHRAFQPMPPTRDATFNGAPTGPNAPRFWFKVPQMPMTPARKLRNPPQPYLQAPLVETKENFFKSMTERGPMDTKRFGRVANRPEYPMAQPKFFPPGSMEDQTGLADLLSSSWKIGDDEEDNVNSIGGMVSKEGGKATQMFKSLVEVLQYIISVIIAIALSAGLWKFLAVVALSSSFYIVVGALVAAMLVNSAIILDTTLTIARRRATWASFLKLAFATTETAVAAHIMSIFADDGEKIGFEERVKGALVLVAALVSCTSKYRKWR